MITYNNNNALEHKMRNVGIEVEHILINRIFNELIKPNLNADIMSKSYGIKWGEADHLMDCIKENKYTIPVNIKIENGNVVDIEVSFNYDGDVLPKHKFKTCSVKFEVCDESVFNRVNSKFIMDVNDDTAVGVVQYIYKIIIAKYNFTLAGILNKDKFTMKPIWKWVDYVQ